MRIQARTMAIQSQTFVKDIFEFLKTDLLNNVEDPLAVNGIRASDSDFVLTAYPKKQVQYPIITLKITNMTAQRAGMQTTAIDTKVRLEIRIWARNTKERDTIFQDVLNRLKNIQFTTTGSAITGLHDFNMLSAIEINEEGDNTPKCKLVTVEYTYYNPN